MNPSEIEKIAARVCAAFAPGNVRTPAGCAGFSDPQVYECPGFSCSGDYQCGGVAGFTCTEPFSCESGFFCSCVFSSPQD